MNRNNKNRKRQASKPNLAGYPPATGSKLTLKTPLSVKGAISTPKELNFVDIADTAYVIDTTGTLTLLNGIATGDDYSARNGRLVKIKGVEIVGSAKATVTTGLPQPARILLFWDNACSGVAPAITDVLAASTPHSYPLQATVERFTVLWDYQFVLDYNAATTSRSITPFSIHIPLNVMTSFNGTGATVASISNGGLFMITLGGNVAGTTAGTANIATRVRFLEE